MIALSVLPPNHRPIQRAAPCPKVTNESSPEIPNAFWHYAHSQYISGKLDATFTICHSHPMTKTHTSFATFWPFYLREHSKRQTRALHYVGTTLVVAVAAFALWSGIARGNWLWLVALPVLGPLAGYFFAWVAHFGVEKNRPATFTYPLWSLAADFKMWWLWLTGRILPELEKAGVKAKQ